MNAFPSSTGTGSFNRQIVHDFTFHLYSNDFSSGDRIGVPVSGTLTSTAAAHASASHVLGSNTEILSTVDRRAERVQRKPSSHRSINER